MVELPDALFDRVQAGDVVLCTGVSFAANAQMPAWSEVLLRMSDKLGPDGDPLRSVIDAGHLLTAAGYLKRKLGNDTLAEVLREAYANGGKPTPLHELLGELPFHAALNTGYDRLIVETLSRNGKKPKVYSYTDGAVLRLAEDLKHFVVQAHGNVHEPQNLVLNRLDYKRLIGANHAYRGFIEDLYRTRTLLLVGYQANDPDFLLLLDRLMATFRDAVSDHYAILPNMPDAEIEELYANHRLRVFTYDDGEDTSAALGAVLEALREGWRAKGPSGEEAQDPLKWLTHQLLAVQRRIDVVAGEGLSLTEGRLNRIRDTASGIDLSKLEPDTLCRLGNIRLYLGELSGAIACYNAALKIEDHAIAHLNLHHAMAEAREYAKAFKHLEKATKLDESLRVVPKRYDLKGVIGRGTTGTVYHARDGEQDRDVTVKVLRVSYVREHVSPERWLKETEVVTLLSHPNIVQVHEALIEGGRCILVTENLNGQNLSDLLKDKGPQTPERAAEVMTKVCEALVYAHQQQVLHLDIMPSNIFLRDDGGVAVMDFRSGRAQKGRHVTVKKGSEGFQAPELLAGAGADERADVYSLGATLYYMLTGRLPIGAFPALADAAPAARRFQSLVSRSLRALPTERPASVEEFARILAGSSEAVAIPENENDVDGWLEVLAYQPEHEQACEALGRLEQQFRDEKDWVNLVDMLIGRIEYEPDADRRLEMLRDVARIYELEVGDLGKAFTALAAAFRVESTSVEIRKDLERLAGATGMWNELLQEYTTLVQGLRDPKVACDWWVRMGHLYAQELGHDDYAAAAFNQALTLDNNRLDALAELSEVVKRKGEHKEYARLLGRMAQLQENPARRVDVLKDLARTHAKELDNDEEAISAYRQILEIDAGHQATVKALDQLYRKGEMWEDLAELLKGALDSTDAANEQLAYRRELGDIFAEQLKRPDEAIAQLEFVLEADPDDAAALRGLERLYDETGRNAEYLKVLDRRIEAAPSDDEKVALYRRLATEWEGQSGGKQRAAEYLERARALGGGDEEVYKSLIRLYWELGAHQKLAEAYREQVQAVEVPEERIGLYAALGKVYEDHLGEQNKAIEAYNSLLALDGENKIALGALARLYEATEGWAQAVQMLQKLAPKEEDIDQQVERFYRIGLLQLEKINKADEAEGSLVKALELKDDHTPSLVALSQLNQTRKDFGKAARLMREAAQHTPNELERVERFHRSAVTYLDDLGDEDKAIEVFEELLALDPEHVASAQRLSSLYEKREAWGQAQPLLEMMVRKMEAKDRERVLDVNLRLGEVYVKGGENEKAIEAFRRAYESDPTHGDALSKLAEQLYEGNQQEEAGKLYQALLVHRRDSMAPERIIKVFMRLGEIKKAAGEDAKALNMFEKALDVDPTNAEVLDRLIAAYTEKDDQESVLRAKKNLLKGITEEEARVLLLEEIGDLLLEKLKRSKEAVTFYEQALQLQPEQRRVLNKTMEAYISQKHWDGAIEVLKKLVELETDSAHRYRLHYTAAIILRDELKRPRDAAVQFDRALEVDPTNMKAFSALEALFTQQHNYEGLVKAYRRMLKRLPDDTPAAEQVRLWHELGCICRDKLKDARGAIIAFEVAAKLDPTDVERQEHLGRLYVTAGPDAYDKAIQVNQRLLRHNPMRLEAYKELRRLYAEQGQLDKTWCVCAALSLLNRASAEEKAVYDKHRPSKLRRVDVRLGAELWAETIRHVDQTTLLNDLFAAVAPVMVPMAARPRSAFGLKAGERLNPEDDTRGYAHAYRYTSEVLDLRPEELYLRADLQKQLSVSLVGDAEHCDTLLWVHPGMLEEGRSEAELHFHFGHTLSLLRPEHVLYAATGSGAVLQAAVLACLKLVDPSAKVSGDLAEIDRLAAVLKTDLQPRHLDRLAGAADELRQAANEAKIRTWMIGTDLSLCRAGLVLCDDLETAARLVVDPTTAEEGALQPKLRLAQLFVYAVSEEYFKLRTQLKLQVS